MAIDKKLIDQLLTDNNHAVERAGVLLMRSRPLHVPSSGG
jgi:hypothetical protein